MKKLAKVHVCILIFVSTGQEKSLLNPKLNKGYLCLQQYPSLETRQKTCTLLSTSYKDIWDLGFSHDFFLLVWNRRTNTYIDSRFSVRYVFFYFLTKNLVYWSIYTSMVSLLLDQRDLNIILYIKVWFWLCISKHLYWYFLVDVWQMAEMYYKKIHYLGKLINYVELHCTEPRCKYWRFHLNSSLTDSISSINYSASKR